MPSPFPGMNPYFEQEDVWHDFHERFCPLAAEIIGSQVDSTYIVKIDEHIYIHELPGRRVLVGRSDVSVAHPVARGTGGSLSGTIEAPVHVQLPEIDTERHSFIEIRDRRSRQLIAVIELLSPSNKQPGADRDQYAAKRAQLLASTAHFVEVDLLRGGQRLPLSNLPACDYYVLVSRAEARPDAGVWPIRMREKLPIVPVPLRAGEADAKLDLQEVINRIYDVARYGAYIYDTLPTPAMSAEDSAWAAKLIPAAER